jgi:hypothetical protein
MKRSIAAIARSRSEKPSATATPGMPPARSGR